MSGLPKGDKLEWIIQKGTEFGAAKFIPFTAARSVVKWDEKKADKKVEPMAKNCKRGSRTIPSEPWFLKYVIRLISKHLLL